MTMNEDNNTFAHGAGVGLLALLGLFGRCADDIARIGVNSVDDIGRASIKSADEFGLLTSRSGDDLLRPVDDFHHANLPLDPSTHRLVPMESDEGVSVSPEAVKEVGELTFKIIDLKVNENDK